MSEKYILYKRISKYEHDVGYTFEGTPKDILRWCFNRPEIDLEALLGMCIKHLGNRLRYGMPKLGQRYLDLERGFLEATAERISVINVVGGIRLILDPEPEPQQDEWEKWCESMPHRIDCMVSPGESWWEDSMILWLKRMPR